MTPSPQCSPILTWMPWSSGSWVSWPPWSSALTSLGWTLCWWRTGCLCPTCNSQHRIRETSFYKDRETAQSIPNGVRWIGNGQQQVLVIGDRVALDFFGVFQSRNWNKAKTVHSDHGNVPVASPLDFLGTPLSSSGHHSRSVLILMPKDRQRCDICIGSGVCILSSSLKSFYCTCGSSENILQSHESFFTRSSQIGNFTASWRMAASKTWYSVEPKQRALLVVCVLKGRGRRTKAGKMFGLLAIRW